MRTEINKKRRRPSERSEEARGKGAKRGNNSWGGWWGSSPGGVWGSFEVYNCQKRNFLIKRDFLAGNAGHSRHSPPQFYCINTRIGQFNPNKKIQVEIKNSEIRVSVDISYA